MDSVTRPAPLQQDPAAVIALKNLKDRVQSGIQRYRRGPADPRPQRGPHTNDFARLARRICGKSIGVVLGGGGARGISHLVSFCLGALRGHVFTCHRACCVHSKNTVSQSITSEVRRSLHISPARGSDAHAGTSIGALVGGLYAREGDLYSSAARTKQFSGRMGNIWRILSDVTYPIVAYTTVGTPVFLHDIASCAFAGP